jgi:hypothetical protein
MADVLQEQQQSTEWFIIKGFTIKMSQDAREETEEGRLPGEECKLSKKHSLSCVSFDTYRQGTRTRYKPKSKTSPAALYSSTVASLVYHYKRDNENSPKVKLRRVNGQSKFDLPATEETSPP